MKIKFFDNYGKSVELKNDLLRGREGNVRAAPSYINDLLIRNCDIHNGNTRYSKLNLNCPRYKRETEGEVGGGVRLLLRLLRLGTVLPVT